MAPNEKFEPNKKREQQTVFLDDVTSVAMGPPQQQGGRGRGKKASAQSNQGFKLSSTQNAGVSKPRSAAPHNRRVLQNKTNLKDGKTSKLMHASTPIAESVPRFYEEDGLRIPLYDERGRRMTHARDGAVLGHKGPRAKLEGIVRAYAGEAKVHEFSNAGANNKQIGAWIQEVETKAFGSGPKKGESQAKAKEMPNAVAALGAKDIPAKQSGGEKAMEQRRANVDSDRFVSKIGSNNLGKRKRDDNEITTLPQQTPKKSKIQFQSTVPKARPDHTLSSQHKKSHASPGSPKQKKTRFEEPTTSFKHSNDEKRSAKPQHTKEKDMPLFLVTIDNKHELEHHPLIDAMELNFDWDPLENPEPSATKVLALPLAQNNVIVTATSQTAVHTTEVPMSDIGTHAIAYGKHQEPRDPSNSPNFTSEDRSGDSPIFSEDDIPSGPYLKSGIHGWDDEYSCWGFEGDPDLYTGVGHQVEPEDAKAYEEAETYYMTERRKLDDELKEAKRKYERGLEENESKLCAWSETYRVTYNSTQEMLEMEWAQARKKHTKLETSLWRWWANEPGRIMYQERYPGMAAGQWPCGCPILCDDESGEESEEE